MSTEGRSTESRRPRGGGRHRSVPSRDNNNKTSSTSSASGTTTVAAAVGAGAPSAPPNPLLRRNNSQRATGNNREFFTDSTNTSYIPSPSPARPSGRPRQALASIGGGKSFQAALKAALGNNNNNKEHASLASSPSSSHTRRQSLASAPASASTRRSPVQVSELGSPTPNLRTSTTFPHYSAARTPSPHRRAPSAPPLISPASFLSESSEPPEALPEIYQQILEEELIAEAGATDDDLSGSGKTSPDRRRFKRISASPSGLSNSIRAFSPIPGAREQLAEARDETFDANSQIDLTQARQAEEQEEEVLERGSSTADHRKSIALQQEETAELEEFRPEIVLEETTQLESVQSQTSSPLEAIQQEPTQREDQELGEEVLPTEVPAVQDSLGDVTEASELHDHNLKETVSAPVSAESQLPPPIPEGNKPPSSASSSSFEEIVSTDPEMLARDERRVKELIDSDRKAFSKAGARPATNLTAENLTRQAAASPSGSSSRGSQSRSSGRVSEPSLRLPSGWGSKARSSSKWMERIRNGSAEQATTVSAAEAQGNMASQGTGGASHAVSAWLQNATMSPLSEAEEEELAGVPATNTTERRGTPQKLDRQAFSKAREWEAQKNKADGTLSPKSQNALRERSIERLEKSAVATNRLTALGQARSLEKLVSPRASQTDLREDADAAAALLADPMAGQVQASSEHIFKKPIARMSSDPQLTSNTMPSISLDLSQNVNGIRPSASSSRILFSTNRRNSQNSQRSGRSASHIPAREDSPAGSRALQPSHSDSDPSSGDPDRDVLRDAADAISVHSSRSDGSMGRRPASRIPRTSTVHVGSTGVGVPGKRTVSPRNLAERHPGGEGTMDEAENRLPDIGPAELQRSRLRAPGYAQDKGTRSVDFQRGETVHGSAQQSDGGSRWANDRQLNKGNVSLIESDETAEGTYSKHARSDSRDLLRRFARASSSSPAPNKVAKSESQTSAMDPNDETAVSAEPMHSQPAAAAVGTDTSSMKGDNPVNDSRQAETSPVEVTGALPNPKPGIPETKANGSAASQTPAVKVGGTYLKTPKVVGGWVDTPLATARKLGIISENGSDQADIKESLTNEESSQTMAVDSRDLDALAKTAPKLPRSALTAIVEHAKRKNKGEEGSEGDETLQLDEATIRSLEELLAEENPVTVQREEHAQSQAEPAPSTVDPIPTIEKPSNSETQRATIQEPEEKKKKKEPTTTSSIMNGLSRVTQAFSSLSADAEATEKKLQELSTLSVPSKERQDEPPKKAPIESSAAAATKSPSESPTRKKPSLAIEIEDPPKQAKKPKKAVAILAPNEQCDEAGEFHDFIWPCENCRRRAKSGASSSSEDEKIGVVQWQTVQVPRLWYWPSEQQRQLLQSRKDNNAAAGASKPAAATATTSSSTFTRAVSWLTCFPRLTLLGWILLIIASFAYAEYRVTEAYTPPFYAEVMYDYGVDAYAPRPPFVLTKLIWRSPFGAIFRAVWTAVCVLVRAVTGVLGVDAGVFGHGGGGSALATPAAQKRWIYRDIYEPAIEFGHGAQDIGLGQDEIWF